jgi:SpoVK/Ycf46/Vps4 family AAA+-type ATPase
LGNTRTERTDPRVTQYRRMAGLVTGVAVLHETEKEALIAAHPVWKRKNARLQLQAEWKEQEQGAATEVGELIALYDEAITTLETALDGIKQVAPIRIQGKVADERIRLRRARSGLNELRASVDQGDFGAAGRGIVDMDKELWAFGGPLVLSLNEELKTAAYSRELLANLAKNQEERRAARREIEVVRGGSGDRAAFAESVKAYHLMAKGMGLVAEALKQQVNEVRDSTRATKVGSENSLRVIPPQELERFDDVGGHVAVKELLQRSLGTHLEHHDEAAKYGVGRNSALFHGPSGTGKTMLARAIAGQYGLRYIRVTPASIASPYPHESAKNLARVFELARQSIPCVIFLDEIDAYASARSGLPSAEHREMVTQLLTLLDEYRGMTGLVTIAATNAVDLLDPALREGRFDSKIQVPLPDVDSRKEILEIHLKSRSEAVDWKKLNIDEIAQRTAGRSGAALANLVRVAAEQALSHKRKIGQEDMLAAIGEREATDRTQLENPVHWDDVVMTPALAQRLREILEVVTHPELAEAVGIAAPAGILLYGPPGTGKTTIAKAMATEVRASFYEMSGADLLSKWVGESEERVQKLFIRARENRPSIIFIDEIDALLRRRTATSIAPWEERLVSQFLRELDGLSSSTGVFLVGATNRIDIIDEAIKERRLTPFEVPLPDEDGRMRLLKNLFTKVKLEKDVDLSELARATDGLSGADLKRLRDEVGMKALSRGLQQGKSPGSLTIAVSDFYESLQERRTAVIPE